VRIRILGDADGLTAPARQAVLEAMERTKGNEGLQLNIALNYGARDELLRAVRRLMSQAAGGNVQPDDLQWEDLAKELYTAGQPDVDLLIRTSGEQRLSNFLLLQSAYAEMVFPQTLWPDFTVQEYRDALTAYARRERRFGGRTT